MIGYLATIAGIMICSSLFLQTIKIMQRKSSADVSLLMYLIMFPCSIIWFIYGISIHSTPLILTNIIGVISYISIIIACLIYRK